MAYANVISKVSNGKELKRDPDDPVRNQGKKAIQR